jgi:DNA (cytosine-5)-methyltransferase 1
MVDATTIIDYEYSDFRSGIDAIAKAITSSGWKPDYIVGIVRGGSVPAVYLSHKLKIPVQMVHWNTRDTTKWVSNESNCWIPEDIYKGAQVLVVDDIVERYNELGYKVYDKILMCSNYGGYTNRRRLILVAVRNDISVEWKWPEVTHSDEDDTLPNLLTVKDAFDLLDYSDVNSPKNDPDNVAMNHKESTIEKFKKIDNEKKSGTYSSRGSSNRLSFDKPAPTLVPGHSSFQIHPKEHRSITVREGAIITGFPRNFRFVGSHSDRCVQIGNAIPFHLGNALAKSCVELLNNL